MRKLRNCCEGTQVLQKKSSHCELLVLLCLSTLSAHISVPNNMTVHQTLG